MQRPCEKVCAIIEKRRVELWIASQLAGEPRCIAATKWIAFLERAARSARSKTEQVSNREETPISSRRSVAIMSQSQLISKCWPISNEGSTDSASSISQICNSRFYNKRAARKKSQLAARLVTRQLPILILCHSPSWTNGHRTSPACNHLTKRPARGLRRSKSVRTRLTSHSRMRRRASRLLSWQS